MFTWIYPTSYFVSLLGLIFWFYFKNDRNMSKMMGATFLGAFLVYLTSLTFSPGALSFKALILCRDLLVMGLIAQFFSFFKENKLIFFIMLAVLTGTFQFQYKSVLTQTFIPAAVKNENVLLDANWELLVEIKEGHKIAELDAIILKYGLTYEAAFKMARPEATDLDNYFVVNIPAEKENELAKIEKELEESELTVWVEQNELFQIDPIESQIPARPSPAPSTKYGINDPLVDQLWNFEAMEMDKLYRLLKDTNITPAKKASILVLDTGIDAAHEDLNANYKSIDKTYDTDLNGHGTHCAGIAASVTNNGVGIASFSSENQFVTVGAVKVLGKGGNGSQRGVINGILAAADHEADVISLSLGSRSNDQKQKAFKTAVDYAAKAGAIVVVAAGNSNIDAKHFAPANTPGVITVSAVDNELNRASFSNFVSNIEMGIAAPGVNILSTIPDDKYAAFNGTSMAAPHVSGLIGLMKSIDPALTTSEAYQIIHQTGTGTKATKETGRLIHPAKAIEALLK